MTPSEIGVIACEVLRLEVEALLDPEAPCIFVEQKLHNTPELLRTKLQEEIDRLEREQPQITGIALIYGLCSRAVEELRATRCRICIPRAHDCITLLLGDRAEYALYLAAHPGTYWYSPGWNATGTQPGPERYEQTLKSYLEKFDEEDAQYLMETEQNWMKEYTRACYVDIGIGDREAGQAYTAACAGWLNWEHDFRAGDPALLRDLLHGDWDNERFIVLAPGESAVQSVDEKVLKKAGE